MFDKLPLKIHLNPCTGYLFLLDVLVTSRLQAPTGIRTSLYSTELSNWSLFFSKANASSAIKTPLSPERENLYRYKENASGRTLQGEILHCESKKD